MIKKEVVKMMNNIINIVLNCDEYLRIEFHWGSIERADNGTIFVNTLNKRVGIVKNNDREKLLKLVWEAQK